MCVRLSRELCHELRVLAPVLPSVQMLSTRCLSLLMPLALESSSGAATSMRKAAYRLNFQSRQCFCASVVIGGSEYENRWHLER